MSILIKSPYPIYTDVNGDPLEDGYIFIGQPGLNPLSSPMQAYWDAELTVPASNIRTKGGYPSDNGTPGQLFVDTDYSLLLQDKKQALVLYTAYSRDTSEVIESELATYQDGEIIMPNPFNLDIILDTTLGDGVFTLNDGVFEGQRATFIVNGTGIAELNGWGDYSIYVSLNGTGTKSLKLLMEWINGEWIPSSGVTADYVDGIWNSIILKTDRSCVLNSKNSQDIVDTASGSIFRTANFVDFTFPFELLSSSSYIPYVELVNQSTIWGSCVIITNTTASVRYLSATNNATFLPLIEIKGEYA